MNSLSLMLVTVLAGSSLPNDLCEMTAVSIELSSQNGLDIIKRKLVRENGLLFADLVAYPGEPIIVHLGMRVARIRPPAAGLTVQVFRDDEVVLAVPFTEWKQHGSTKDYEGADFSSIQYRGVLTALPLGVYIFKVAPLGCDRSRRENQTYAGRTLRLNVRAVATPRDQAHLHMYRANQAAYWRQDCAMAFKELVPVEAYDPEEFQAIGLRAECAKWSGELERALALYEKLEAKLDEKRRATGLGLHLMSYDAKIQELRGALGSRGNAAPSSEPGPAKTR